MAFKNVGTFDLGKAATQSARTGNAAVFNMDAAGIASGEAFLTSELEKRDMLVRTPLTSLTYSRDIPIRVGGGIYICHAGGIWNYRGIGRRNCSFWWGQWNPHGTGRLFKRIV